MQLSVNRKTLTDNSTIGDFLIDGVFTYFSLEPTVRPSGVKIQNKTAIMPGTFQVIINFSDRFQRPMPLLLNVPGFEGIRIHVGNYPHDTDGCICVGSGPKEPDFIGGSDKAFADFFPRLQSALQTGKVWITIS